jgi:ABC-type transporter Mla maintaining outer membrane lipid asymmetry ATPase subunit MlaF
VPAVALEVSDVVKRFGDRTVIDGLSFSVPV